MVRTLRWPDSVACPHCQAAGVNKDGRNDTQPHRQLYLCKASGRLFDDLAGTIFAVHHQPLRTWIPAYTSWT